MKVTRQTCAPEKLRWCRWGAEWKVKPAQTQERGPPSAPAELSTIFVKSKFSCNLREFFTVWLFKFFKGEHLAVLDGFNLLITGNPRRFCLLGVTTLDLTILGGNIFYNFLAWLLIFGVLVFFSSADFCTPQRFQKIKRLVSSDSPCKTVQKYPCSINHLKLFKFMTQPCVHIVGGSCSANHPRYLNPWYLVLF